MKSEILIWLVVSTSLTKIDKCGSSGNAGSVAPATPSSRRRTSPRSGERPLWEARAASKLDDVPLWAPAFDSANKKNAADMAMDVIKSRCFVTAILPSFALFTFGNLTARRHMRERLAWPAGVLRARTKMPAESFHTIRFRPTGSDCHVGNHGPTFCLVCFPMLRLSGCDQFGDCVD